MQNHLTKCHALLAGLLVASGIFSAPPVNASSLENMAKSLAKIRGEVETLQTQLDIEKEKHANQITALSSQLADLSVEERRQKTAIEKLEHTLEKLSQASKQAEQSGEQLKPVLLKALAHYKHYVLGGYPFRIEDRIKAIEMLEDNIERQLVDPNKAVNQAWALIEDEIRLSKENGLYQQAISLDGEKVLADIAKIGTVFLFFQTRDNRAGMAKPSKDGQWKFETVATANDTERIARLFDALKKQIRQGYFELPNPLK
ncbi:MAG: DUF3450 family protein [Nitrosomonas sp.]|nr:DUF3450 family protein [Nitrosomonas sp.]MCP5252055.1 DUF3450 family protein [Burkholderiales bacterium]HQU62959.1 DUF3450 family protein [Nitrosomonas sp.]